MFRVIIAGGRNFQDYDMLTAYMDFLLSKTTEDVEIVLGWLAEPIDLEKNM